MSEKLDKIIEDLKSLTLLEASELVSEIEKVFGVDTSISVAAVAAPVAGGDAGAAGGDSDQTEFEITLTDVPADKKIAILKLVRNFTGLGLKESKEIVDSVPKLIKEGVSKAEAEGLQKEIEEAGGKVTIK